MLRQLHRQLQMIFSNTLLKCNKVLLNALEYPIPTPGGKNGSSAVGSSDFEQEYFNFKFLDLESEGGTVGIPEGLFQPSPYSGSSITPAAPSDNITLHFDLIIVGSGSGGGVVASTLAQSLIHKFPGYRILVIDKGTFYPPPTSLPMSEMDTAEKMCDNGGLLPSVDGEGLMIGGSTWGGGSVINWGISLDLEEDVRKEWSQKHGLNWMVKETKEVSIENEDITDNEWDSCLSHVKNIMGVSLLSSPSLHNVPNTLISEGARKAGYHPVPVSHNNGEDSEAHADCGYCSGGCQRGLKKAGSVSWLVDAAKAGAMCLKEFDVERIIWNTETGGSDSGNWGQKNKPKRVEGVEGRVVKTNGKGRAVKLMASKVILAAGAIRTPCILQNSGLKV